MIREDNYPAPLLLMTGLFVLWREGGKMTLTPEERQKRYEKAVARNKEIRGIRDRQAANRKARIREKGGK